MYIINDKLSKEENLELAKAYEEKAKDLLFRFDAILKESSKEFPGNTFRLTKSQLAKHQSPSESYQRVKNAAFTLNRVEASYRERERMAEEKLRKQKNEEFLKEIEAKKSNLINEAISYCLINGKIFGQDGFEVDTAVSIANEIAFKKEVERQESEIGDDYIGFTGQNCDDDCSGWNPKDRRCQCGNRRVSWTDGYGDFRNMSIYAEAY